MPNVQGPLADMSPEIAVACAILCCDEKPYEMTDKDRDAAISCQRLASRKHSCVLHALRDHTESGKLTQDNSSDDVLASPRSSKEIDGKIRIPDTIIKKGGKWVCVDAKFPCDSEELNDQMPLEGDSYTPSSPSVRGKSMATEKEDETYRKFKNDDVDQVSDSYAKTPEEAQNDVDDADVDCECENVPGCDCGHWVN